MYKSTDYEHEQLSFINFNMACGMQLDMNNEWIRIAQQLPWKAWEALYVAIFPSNTGNVAKPCRMVLGSLILQMRLGFTDRELVDQLRQNPYYQYFIGLPSFQHTAPFTRTLLVEWRKRIDFLPSRPFFCNTIQAFPLAPTGDGEGAELAPPHMLSYPPDTLIPHRRSHGKVLGYF